MYISAKTHNHDSPPPSTPPLLFLVLGSSFSLWTSLLRTLIHPLHCFFFLLIHTHIHTHIHLREVLISCYHFNIIFFRFQGYITDLFLWSMFMSALCWIRWGMMYGFYFLTSCFFAFCSFFLEGVLWYFLAGLRFFFLSMLCSPVGEWILLLAGYDRFKEEG